MMAGFDQGFDAILRTMDEANEYDTHHARRTRDELTSSLSSTCRGGGGCGGGWSRVCGGVCVKASSNLKQHHRQRCQQGNSAALTHYHTTTPHRQNHDGDDRCVSHCERGPLACTGVQLRSLHRIATQTPASGRFALLLLLLLRCYRVCFFPLLFPRRLFFGQGLPRVCPRRDPGLDLGIRP